MNIAATQYNLQNKALEIYVSGCLGNCPGCHNEELKDFCVGETWAKAFEGIVSNLKTFGPMIDKVWILGGEPLDQGLYPLLALIEAIRIYFHGELWIFTRYDVDNIPEKILKANVDYIKCGEYNQKLTTDDNIVYGVKLATSNQYIMKNINNEWKRL